MRKVQVRAKLRIALAVERVAGEAGALEDGETASHFAVRRQRRIGQDRRETFDHAAQLADAGQLVRPLFRAHAGGLRPGPHDVERPGAAAVLVQRGPAPGRLFDRQPGFAAVRVHQQGSGDLRGEAVAGDELQVIVGTDAFEQGGQRHGAVVHRAMERDIVGHADRARVAALEQGFGAIGDDAMAEIDFQLGGRCGQRQARHEQVDGEQLHGRFRREVKKL